MRVAKKWKLTEAARTKWNIHGDKGGADRAGIKGKKLYKAGSQPISKELEVLRKQNEEYRKALVLFKDKLNEVCCFQCKLGICNSSIYRAFNNKTRETEYLEKIRFGFGNNRIEKSLQYYQS